MVSGQQRKLISCLGFAFRLARRLESDKVAEHLRLTVTILVKTTPEEAPKLKRKISLYDALQEAPYHSTQASDILLEQTKDHAPERLCPYLEQDEPERLGSFSDKFSGQDEPSRLESFPGTCDDVLCALLEPMQALKDRIDHLASRDQERHVQELREQFEAWTERQQERQQRQECRLQELQSNLSRVRELQRQRQNQELDAEQQAVQERRSAKERRREARRQELMARMPSR